MPTLLIADDHPLFRAALRGAAADAVAQLQVLEAESLDGVLAALESRADIDLWSCSTCTCPATTALAGLAAIRAQFPAVAVVVVSANDDPRVVRRALDHGAAGYLPKSSGLDELREAIRSVLACEQWLPASLRASVSRAQSSHRDTELAARLGQPVAAAVPRAQPWSRRACSTSRSPTAWTCRNARSRHICPRSSSGWACATGPRPGWSCANWN